MGRSGSGAPTGSGWIEKKQPGFSRMLLASMLIHSAALAAILIAVKTESARTSYRPAHTVVEIVEAEILKPEEEKTPLLPETAKPAPPQEKQKAPLPKEKPLKDKPSGKASLDKKIAAMEKKLEKKGAEESVKRRIKEFEGKSAKKEIEDLRRELAEQAKGKPSVPAGPDMPERAKNASLPKELFELKFKTYYNTVGSMIQSAWIYPGEAKKTLSVWLAIRISPAGELVSIRIEKRSGDSIFDESAMRAVKKAAPFPPVPEEIKNEFSEPLIIRFCPGGCAE